MSSTNTFDFTQTIRFKLTLLYSGIFFVATSFLVLSLNLYLEHYLNSSPVIRRPYSMQQQLFFDFEDLQLQERERIREIRLNDLRQIQQLSFASLAPIAIVSFMLGYFISGRFLSPLGKLQQELAELNSGDLGKSIPIKVKDEVGLLIESFNNMSARLKTSFDSQEQFVQDAAHELRTPLTVIQTNLDTILDDESASNGELRLAIQNSLQGMKDLRDLSDHLLELTLTDRLQKKDEDLSIIVKQQVELLKPLASIQKVRLDLTAPESLPIKCDAIFLSRAIYNLIDNGIKYSAKSVNATVHVDLRISGEVAELNVTDNGIGIPTEDLAKIFRRFYRVDKSRNRTKGGFGLGLAIAQKIVQAHMGELSATSTKGKTVFTLTLPRY